MKTTGNKSLMCKASGLYDSVCRLSAHRLRARKLALNLYAVNRPFSSSAAGGVRQTSSRSAAGGTTTLLSSDNKSCSAAGGTTTLLSSANKYSSAAGGVRQLGLLIFLLLGLLISSCSMMHEDLSDCPTGLYVRFVYDYNIVRADIFKDHVGYVRLFVYDDKGDLVAERIVANTENDAPLKNYGYAIHFADGELPAGRYRLQAIAFQKHHDEALATPGAKYRHNTPEKSEDLLVELDHIEEQIAGTEKYPVSNAAPLDTLWHTLKVTSLAPSDGVATPPLAATAKPYTIYPVEEQYVEVADGMATYASISLIRDTKHINILLRQIDDPDNISHADFDVAISDRNKSLAHDNSPASDLLLHYTPYQKWTSRFDGNSTIVETDEDTRSGHRVTALQRTAHYNLMCNRMIHSHNADEAACLTITNKKTGEKVVEINLPSMLAEARIAYDAYHYSEQEYLDREYDYHLHFFLKGDTWEYCEITINTLSWSKRIQREAL